jgi:hypothetical protein
MMSPIENQETIYFASVEENYTERLLRLHESTKQLQQELDPSNDNGIRISIFLLREQYRIDRIWDTENNAFITVKTDFSYEPKQEKGLTGVCASWKHTFWYKNTETLDTDPEIKAFFKRRWLDTGGNSKNAKSLIVCPIFGATSSDKEDFSPQGCVGVLSVYSTTPGFLTYECLQMIERYVDNVNRNPLVVTLEDMRISKEQYQQQPSENIIVITLITSLLGQSAIPISYEEVQEMFEELIANHREFNRTYGEDAPNRASYAWQILQNTYGRIINIEELAKNFPNASNPNNTASKTISRLNQDFLYSRLPYEFVRVSAYILKRKSL